MATSCTWKGAAPHAWIEMLRRNALSIPGVVKLDDSKLVDAESGALA